MAVCWTGFLALLVNLVGFIQRLGDVWYASIDEFADDSLYGNAL
jgi:hypothetical protein